MSDIDFAALIEPVARRLWGEPNARLCKKGKERVGATMARGRST